MYNTQPKPGYKPICCGNDLADIFIIFASLVLLYIGYALFWTAMYYFWLYAQDGALYTFLALMAVYWITVGLLVYFGSVTIEAEAKEAELLEAARLEEESKEKRV